ncbi:hypothetical protein RG963_11295 [Methanosarcina sp. Z-7115]|uniref:Mobile element protein n=1 Tax=Methanosarcina baikalica TaxID=3073890 RepID=A0ABU2D2Z0_9EURY|nr:hypothetical protein [Methanosarcina sp. Z-7115]MDR7666355.1 hypothetical protein [Methanosarcina sp. Z-7115]
MIRANILEHKCLIAILRKGKYREKALYEKNIRKKYSRISFYPDTGKWNITFCIETTLKLQPNPNCSSVLDPAVSFSW